MAFGIGAENAIKWVAQKIKEKIEKNKDFPEAVRVLKELGREAIDSLPNVPEWANEYLKLFRD